MVCPKRGKQRGLRNDLPNPSSDPGRVIEHDRVGSKSKISENRLKSVTDTFGVFSLIQLSETGMSLSILLCKWFGFVFVVCCLLVRGRG